MAGEGTLAGQFPPLGTHATLPLERLCACIVGYCRFVFANESRSEQLSSETECVGPTVFMRHTSVHIEINEL